MQLRQGWSMVFVRYAIFTKELRELSLRDQIMRNLKGLDYSYKAAYYCRYPFGPCLLLL